MSKRGGFKFSYALSIATQLGFMIAASIGGFLALGVWLDRLTGAVPLFLLLGIFIGITITVVEVHHMIKPLLKEDKKEEDIV